MSESDFLLSLGVNTGNSLDAADVVLTRFGENGSIEDLVASSLAMPKEMSDRLRLFRTSIMNASGEMNAAVYAFDKEHGVGTADQLIKDYTQYVAQAVTELAAQAKDQLGLVADVVGFHGQTCAHQPPSIAKNAETAYTIQIGDGQLLADLVSLPVVYDFRSDDLINGGEAAPLAPVHHQHLASHLKSLGKFPIAFCNAGNTGNISVITEKADGAIVTYGWDVGPFNDYPDKLMQIQRGQPCDRDAEIGKTGKVSRELLQALFEKGAVTEDGANFLLKPPPKSSDPQWYRLLPEMLGEDTPDLSALPFEDRLRTAEYFSAYVYFYSLKWIVSEVAIPTCFALCGGGWNNPVSREHFANLLNGNFADEVILLDHLDLFQSIAQRLKATSKAIEIDFADRFGFSGQFMEARLFADAAVSRIRGLPFSTPETTGCRQPSILGIIRYPGANSGNASANFKAALAKANSANATPDPAACDRRWGRASSGWIARLQ